MLETALDRLPLRLEWDGGGSRLAPVEPGVRGGLARIAVAMNEAVADGTWRRLKICADHECDWAKSPRVEEPGTELVRVRVRQSSQGACLSGAAARVGSLTALHTLTHMPIDRNLVWEGCFNVRDLGGLPTVDGHVTRTGAVVRADSINTLSRTGWAALQAHGVRTVINLRDDPGDDVSPRPTGLATVQVPRLMTNAGERCESTWSGPFWASSSSTKIADSFQNRLRLIASTSRPSATSFSATMARGVGASGRVP